MDGSQDGRPDAATGKRDGSPVSEAQKTDASISRMDTTGTPMDSAVLETGQVQVQGSRLERLRPAASLELPQNTFVVHGPDIVSSPPTTGTTRSTPGDPFLFPAASYIVSLPATPEASTIDLTSANVSTSSLTSSELLSPDRALSLPIGVHGPRSISTPDLHASTAPAENPTAGFDTFPSSSTNAGLGMGKGKTIPRPRVIRFRSRVRIASSTSGAGLGWTPSSSTSPSPSSSISVPIKWHTRLSTPGSVRIGGYGHGHGHGHGHGPGSSKARAKGRRRTSWREEETPGSSVSPGGSDVDDLGDSDDPHPWGEDASAGDASARGHGHRRAPSERARLLSPHSRSAHSYGTSGGGGPIPRPRWRMRKRRNSSPDSVESESREEWLDETFGRWPRRVWNPHWWWWNMEPVVCYMCDESDDE